MRVRCCDWPVGVMRGKGATRSRSARTGRNPGTGESVSIPASKAPPFRAGKALRDAVNEGWTAKADGPGG